MSVVAVENPDGTKPVRDVAPSNRGLYQDAQAPVAKLPSTVRRATPSKHPRKSNRSVGAISQLSLGDRPLNEISSSARCMGKLARNDNR